MSTFTKTLLKSSIYSTEDISSQYDVALSVFTEISRIMEGVEFNGFYINALIAISDSIRHLRSKDDVGFYSAAGKARVLLGLAFVSAYIPDYPVDPTSEPRLHVNLLNKKKQEHTDNIEIRSNIETVYTGNNTNETINLLSSSCQITIG
jgi:midasin